MGDLLYGFLFHENNTKRYKIGINAMGKTTKVIEKIGILMTKMDREMSTKSEKQRNRDVFVVSALHVVI